VSFSVPELQQQAVAAASQVELVADALPGESFTARISALNPSIDVNGRALQVRGMLDNEAKKLRPGLLVRVTVKGPARDAVLIPESAIVQRGQGALVYVVADNKVREVRVQLGKRLEGKVEIRDGISAGDMVVTAGNTRLRDGAEVEIVSAAAKAE
jgi:membrane fusion protein (multidrug efflux system)